MGNTRSINKARIPAKPILQQPSHTAFHTASIQSASTRDSRSTWSCQDNFTLATIPFKGGTYTGMVLILFDSTRLPHGEGIIVFPEGKPYKKITANFHNGIAVGEVVIEYYSGNIYFGPVDKELYPHGAGKYEYPEISCYKKIHARFEHGTLKTNMVTIEYRNGDVYCGSIMARGMPHGFGVVFNAKTGNRYEGEFERGVRIKGKVINPQGEIIEVIRKTTKS